MKAKTQTHQVYRSHCGGGRLKADLTWQGVLPEECRKAFAFVAAACFNNTCDKQLKAALKATSKVSEILQHEPYKAMLQEIVNEVTEPPHGAARPILDSEADFAEPKGLCQLADLDITESMSMTHGEELQSWADHAQEHKEKFIRLVVQPDSATTLASLLQPTVLGSFASSAESKVALLYDAKTQGQCSVHPHVRQPSLDRSRLKLMVQAFCKARGCEDDAPGTAHELALSVSSHLSLSLSLSPVCLCCVFFCSIKSS